MISASRQQQGFTLVEIMVALLIGGVVMAAVMTSFRGQHATYLAQDQVVEVQQNLRVGINMLTREVRMAGYDPLRQGAEINTATADKLLFPVALAEDLQELEYIRYDTYIAYAGTPRARKALGRATGNDPDSMGNRIAVAEFIEQLEFFYLLADGSQTLNPANLADIRGVTITMLARAANEDRRYRDNQVYVTSAGEEWGPFNDGFRRRLLSHTVICRNLGL